jgi:hypothetical protein
LTPADPLPGGRAFETGQQCCRKCDPSLCGGSKIGSWPDTPNGANASATLYSLIETAKACGLEPYRYLLFLFEKLPYAASEANYQALLTQTVEPAQLA